MIRPEPGVAPGRGVSLLYRKAVLKFVTRTPRGQEAVGPGRDARLSSGAQAATLSLRSDPNRWANKGALEGGWGGWSLQLVPRRSCRNVAAVGLRGKKEVACGAWWGQAPLPPPSHELAELSNCWAFCSLHRFRKVLFVAWACLL